MPPSYPPQGGPGGASGTPGVDGTTAAGGGDGTEKRAVEEHGTDGSSAAPERPRKGGLLRETVIVLVTALVLSVLIKTFLVQAFFIPSSSMEDTLAIGDRIMVNKVATATDDIQRGDIVVFVDPGSWLPEAQADTRAPWQRAMGDVLTFVGLLPQDAGHHLVKRVIGVGGDEIECCGDDGRLTVNGEPIDEPYLKPGTQPSATEFHVSVPEGHLWVMGDNRSNSEDSRAHMGEPGGGFVPLDNVEGRVFVVLWPMSSIGLVDSPEQTFADVPEPAAS